MLSKSILRRLFSTSPYVLRNTTLSGQSFKVTQEEKSAEEDVDGLAKTHYFLRPNESSGNYISAWHDINCIPSTQVSEHFTGVIEIVQNTTAKMELNKSLFMNPVCFDVNTNKETGKK